MSARAIPVGRPVLDPFGFPQDTTPRFVLLILAVLGASLFAFNSIHSTLVDPTPAMLASVRCVERVGLDGDLGPCQQLLTHGKATWMLAGLGVMASVAFAFYLLMPRWKLRRLRLRPLTADDAPEVVARLAELADEAGLEKAPRYVWNPLSPAASGLVFGHVGRRYVALGGGLVTKAYTDPDAFRAVVLHEFGHLRNRDVDKTYVTMALWYSFVLVAVLPLLASLYDESGSYISFVLWRLVALVALVYLSRNAILRSRETYADARASQSGARAALRRVLGTLPTPARRRWRRLLSVHPDPKERVANLDDTDRLFRPGLWQAFAAGIVITLVYLELVGVIVAYKTDNVEITWLAALAAAPFAAAVVALGIWRDAFRSLARSAPTAGVWRLGVALGAGFLVGEVLSFHQGHGPGGEQSGPSEALAQLLGTPQVKAVASSAIVGAGVIWVVLPIVSFVLFALWLEATAAIWLSRGGERLTRISLVVTMVAASSLLTVWTGTYFLLHDYGDLSGGRPTVDRWYEEVGAEMWNGPYFLFRFLMDGTPLVFTRWPFIATIALLWALPFSAAAIRGRNAWPSRAFLGPDRPPAPRAERLNVLRAILVGAAAGLAAWAAILALRAVLHASVGSEPLSGNFFFAHSYWEFVLALAAPILAAACAVPLCPRRPILHALLAGFVAGVISTAGVVTGMTIASCVEPLSLESGDCPLLADRDYVRIFGHQVLAYEPAVALIASLAVLAALAVVRRPRQRASKRPAVASPSTR